MTTKKQRALAKQVEHQAKMDRVQRKMDSLVFYLKEKGLNKDEITFTLALMNEYDSAFQDLVTMEEEDERS